MANSVQLKKLTHRHEAILHFMMSNPGVAKWEIAAQFNVTQSWLSCVINSDAFQESLEQHTDEAFHETVLPLRKRMLVLADKTIDRLNQLIPVETSLDVVRKTADSVLQAAGYGSPKTGATGVHNTQNNFFLGNASPEVLARARDRIGKGETYESNGHLQLADSKGRDEGEPAEVETEGSPVGSRNNGAVASVRLDAIRPDDVVAKVSLDSNGRGSTSGDPGRHSGDENLASKPSIERPTTRDARKGEGNPGGSSSDLRPATPSLPIRESPSRLFEPAGGAVAIRLHGTDWGGVSPDAV